MKLNEVYTLMTCEHCGGSEGECRIYLVTTPRGKRVKRTLHVEKCAEAFSAAYLKWFNQKIDEERYAPKDAANGD